MFKGLLPIKSAEKYIFIAVRAQQAVFTLKSKGGIEFLESNMFLLLPGFGFIHHRGKTSRGSESHRSHRFMISNQSDLPAPSSAPVARPALTQSSSAHAGGHSMSCLFRLSSSSDTVRFPMYQNIQRIRLRKISRGPDSTKKSQKLNGAKIPMKKSTRPTMSIITASDRKNLVNLFCSMARAGSGQPDRWISSEGLTVSESGSLQTRAFLSSGSFFITRSTPCISFIAQGLVVRLVSNHNKGLST